MRTTLTLDDDVVKTIKDEMTSGEGKTFKKAVNDLIRLGRYKKIEQETVRRRKPFKVRAKNMGRYPHLNYDNIGELLEQIEGPFHK
ncbi:MAG: hypothetical protein KF881_04700 [Acidobacteria bacterium]|nr:hypothetical protein [Acidobacteriota bacterium]